MERKTKEQGQKVFPHDVKFERVATDLWRDPKGKLWHPLQEARARYENATHTMCKTCGQKDAKYKGGNCSDCINKFQWDKYLAITRTTSDFPVSLDGDQWFWDAGELEEYLEENETKVEDLFLYGCEQIPFQQLDLCYWDDQTKEDGELPATLENLVNEFNEKLKGIPGYWFCDYKTRYVAPPIN